VTDRVPQNWLHWGRALKSALAVLLTVVTGDQAATPQSFAKPPGPCLRASQITELAQSMASGSAASDSYSATVQLAFNNLGAGSLRAFEENRSFVYVLGAAAPHLIRRLIVLKPSIFIVDDQMLPGAATPVTTCLDAEGPAQVSGRRARIVAGNTTIFWETPGQKIAYQTRRQLAADSRRPSYVVQAMMVDRLPGSRSLSVLDSAGADQFDPTIRSELAQKGDDWILTVSSTSRSFRLSLPPPAAGAGEIAVSTANGTTLIGRRLLPSGILPHGPKGNRLLETWDADYRGAKPPAWDIGRPADELQKLVREGTVRSCRAVDLGCGSGTDAIFLASHGFDVTAIDISPTALSQAQEKARKAGVSVRWVLADVVAPPDLGPFDFIYDRGCYHNVRDQNLTAYVDTVRRFSHPGTKFLLLSARRDEHAPAEYPGVTEEEFRYDFLSWFDVEWLREIKLESNEPGVSPPGWSALLIRNNQP